MTKLYREVSLYTVFGLLTTLIGLLFFKILDALGMHYLVANSFSTGLAIIFAYISNRLYVFKSKGHILRESVIFLSVRLSAFMAESLILVMAVSKFKLDAFYSKIVTTIIVVVLNYLLSKFVVFRQSKRRIANEN